MFKDKKAHKIKKPLLGLLLVAFACLATQARADSLVIDPTGDTFGGNSVQLDITSVRATYNDTTLTFTVNFTGPVFAPSLGDPRSVVGFIDIDADRNPATGVSPVTGATGPPPAPDLGVDFGVNLYSEVFDPGQVEIYDVSLGDAVGMAPIVFVGNSFSVAVPLALMGGSSGLVNYALVIGTLDEPTDKAPNGMVPATSQPVPEPATMLLLGTGLAGLGATIRRHRSGGR